MSGNFGIANILKIFQTFHWATAAERCFHLRLKVIRRYYSDPFNQHKIRCILNMFHSFMEILWRRCIQKKRHKQRSNDIDLCIKPISFAFEMCRSTAAEATTTGRSQHKETSIFFCDVFFYSLIFVFVMVVGFVLFGKDQRLLTVLCHFYCAICAGAGT